MLILKHLDVRRKYNIIVSMYIHIYIQVFADVAKIDVSLTTCIAISFLFNALIDARLVPEREYGTLYVG